MCLICCHNPPFLALVKNIMLLSVLRVITPAAILLLPPFQPVIAGELPDFHSKPYGASLELSAQERDLNVADLKIGIPGLDSAVVAAIRNQADATDDSRAVSLRLDYQIKPYLNVFGLAGALQDKVKVRFSGLGAGFPNLDVENNGMLYGVGATLMGRQGQLLGTLTYVHHVADMDGSERKVSADTIAPMLGILTDAGVFSAGLTWQSVDDKYTGTLAVPGIGDVPVEVSAEDRSKPDYSLGFHTQVAKDLYLGGNAGVGGRKHVLLALNKRF